MRFSFSSCPFPSFCYSATFPFDCALVLALAQASLLPFPPLSPLVWWAMSMRNSFSFSLLLSRSSFFQSLSFICFSQSFPSDSFLFNPLLLTFPLSLCLFGSSMSSLDLQHFLTLVSLPAQLLLIAYPVLSKISKSWLCEIRRADISLRLSFPYPLVCAAIFHGPLAAFSLASL